MCCAYSVMVSGLYFGFSYVGVGVWWVWGSVPCWVVMWPGLLIWFVSLVFVVGFQLVVVVLVGGCIVSWA